MYSPSPRAWVALWAALVYLAQWLTITEITTSCFLLFIAKSHGKLILHTVTQKASC